MLIGIILFAFSVRLPGPAKAVDLVGSMTIPLMLLVGAVVAECKFKRTAQRMGSLLYFGNPAHFDPACRFAALKILDIPKLLLTVCVLLAPCRRQPPRPSLRSYDKAIPNSRPASSFSRPCLPSSRCLGNVARSDAVKLKIVTSNQFFAKEEGITAYMQNIEIFQCHKHQ